MMIEAISLDAATSVIPEFSLPDANGLRPLELPTALFSHRSVECTIENPDVEISRKSINQDSVRRFESAMAAPAEQPLLIADLLIKKPFAEPLNVPPPRDCEICITETAPVKAGETPPVNAPEKDPVETQSVQPRNLNTQPLNLGTDSTRIVSKPVAREDVVSAPVASEFVAREVDRKSVSRDDIPVVTEVHIPMENAAPSVIQPRERVVVNSVALRELVRNLEREPVKTVPNTEKVSVKVDGLVPAKVAEKDAVKVVVNVARTTPVKAESDHVNVIPAMGRDPVKVEEKGGNAVEFVQITSKEAIEPATGHVDNTPTVKKVAVPGLDVTKPVASEPVAHEVVDRKPVSRDDVPVVAEVRVTTENAAPSAVQASDRVVVKPDAFGERDRKLEREPVKTVPGTEKASIMVEGLVPPKVAEKDAVKVVVNVARTTPVKAESDHVNVISDMGRDPVKVEEKGGKAVEFVQITPKATVEQAAGHVDNSTVANTVAVSRLDVTKPVAPEPVSREVFVSETVVHETVLSESVKFASVSHEAVMSEPFVSVTGTREVIDRKPVSRDDVPVVAEVRVTKENAVPSAVQSDDLVVVEPDALRELVRNQGRDLVKTVPDAGMVSVTGDGLAPVKDLESDPIRVAVNVAGIAPVKVETDRVNVIPDMGRDPVKVEEKGGNTVEFVQIMPKATVELAARQVDISPAVKTVAVSGPNVSEPAGHETVSREIAAPVSAAPVSAAPVPAAPAPASPVSAAPVPAAPEVERKVADRKSVQGDDVTVVAEVRVPVESLVAAQSAGIAVAVPEDVAASARTIAIAQAVDKVVEAVSAQIEIRPSIVNGEGEIVIRLKPTVLDGSEIKLAAKDGILSMEITPATPQAEQIVARSVPQLERALAEHIPAFHGFTVAVRSRGEERKDR